MAKRTIPKGYQGSWSDLRLYPAQCMKLVIEGKLQIIGKDNFGRWIYYAKETINM